MVARVGVTHRALVAPHALPQDTRELCKGSTLAGEAPRKGSHRESRRVAPALTAAARAPRTEAARAHRERHDGERHDGERHDGEYHDGECHYGEHEPHRELAPHDMRRRLVGRCKPAGSARIPGAPEGVG